MKGKLLIGLAAVVAVAVETVLLASRGPSAQAQPVASISLPAPGAVKQLYPNCNNITLTFPDGTPSQTVVQAVTPPDAVESLWRHSAALGRFEGFNPAFPGASDLPSVSFLDAVWLCMVEGPGVTAPPPPPPGATATATSPAQPPPPPPPSAGVTADLAVTDLFPDNLPQGNVRARITNNGPDALTSANVDLSCSVAITPYGGGIPIAHGMGGPIVVSLNAGQTADFPTGISIDISQNLSQVTCTIQVTFNDPDAANDSFTETFPTADLEIVNIDITAQGWPTNAQPSALLKNNGPGILANVPATHQCEASICPNNVTCSASMVQTYPAQPVTLNLAPGQAVSVTTPHTYNANTDYTDYIKCEVQVPFSDPNAGNNTRTETPLQ